jgi:hypothetical protein
MLKNYISYNEFNFKKEKVILIVLKEHYIDELEYFFINKDVVEINDDEIEDEAAMDLYKKVNKYKKAIIIDREGFIKIFSDSKVEYKVYDVNKKRR